MKVSCESRSKDCLAAAQFLYGIKPGCRAADTSGSMRQLYRSERAFGDPVEPQKERVLRQAQHSSYGCDGIAEQLQSQEERACPAPFRSRSKASRLRSGDGGQIRNEQKSPKLSGISERDRLGDLVRAASAVDPGAFFFSPPNLQLTPPSAKTATIKQCLSC